MAVILVPSSHPPGRKACLMPNISTNVSPNDINFVSLAFTCKHVHPASLCGPSSLPGLPVFELLDEVMVLARIPISPSAELAQAVHNDARDIQILEWVLSDGKIICLIIISVVLPQTVSKLHHNNENNNSYISFQLSGLREGGGGYQSGVAKHIGERIRRPTDHCHEIAVYDTRRVKPRKRSCTGC